MKRIVTGAILALAVAEAAPAQTCGPESFCNEFYIGEVTQQRVGIALSGGNPVPGASSTLGMRLGTIPRISVGVRMTGVQLDIPDLESGNANDELSSIPRSKNIDASIGVFSGLSLFPTVGGFGSIDLLASYGQLSMPDDDGYGDDPDSWGVGLRLGILRESFTAPGVSVSGMYRKIGDVRHQVGEPERDAGTVLLLENNRAINLRATVGKRLLMLGAVAGIGYDRYSSDAQLFVPFSAALERELTTSTTTLFANLSWSMLVVHIVGEAGVQRSDEDAYYGSLAVRLAL